MSSQWSRASCLVGIGLTLSLSAQAAQYLPFRMLSTAQQPFEYYIDSRAQSPAGLSLQNVKTASEAAWKQWNDLQCAAPKVVSKGFTNAVVNNPSDSFDEFNVTPVMVTDRNSAEYRRVFEGSFLAALTIPRSYAGVLERCDIFINAVDFKFSTAAQTASDAYDLRAVMLHEAGHCLGLDHTGGPSAVMAFAVRVGEQLTVLGKDDIDALCARNPAKGAPGTACEANKTCSAGPQPPLKCLTQNTGAKNETLCTRGCDFSAQESCEFPLVCQQSTEFAPNFNGACLLPGVGVTPVGRSCSNGFTCPSTVSICIEPVTLNGGTIAWFDGYCTQPCDNQKRCPPGSQCIAGVSNIGNGCLQSCRLGLSDCRPEYVCSPTDTNDGVCLPRCVQDSDCGDNGESLCRLCDGMCIPRQNASGQIGDNCETAATCGSGQQCLQVSERSTEKICTEQCARGCGTCSNGSSCQSILRGSLYCMKNCSGPGTCPAGQQCTTTSTGRYCIPACQNNTECQFGSVCTNGECLPISDAGCGAFCEVDGGQVITPPAKDAGTGPTSAGGCGCNAPNSTTGGFAAFLYLLIQICRRKSARVS
jgi:hypothetical protein